MFNRDIGSNRNLEFENKVSSLDVPFGDEPNFLDKIEKLDQVIESGDLDFIKKLLSRQRMELMVIKKGSKVNI